MHQARNEVEAFIRRNPGKTREVAFYGGTFTALPLTLQEEYLQGIGELLQAQDSIRISTHPAYIDDSILSFLQARKVKTIELGIQDFNDEVLKQSGRMYNANTAILASRAIQQRGLRLGIQLMPGLPGSNVETAPQNLRQVLLISPNFLRLYPTNVIKGTALADMHAQGRYQALSLQEAIGLCADYTDPCKKHGIRIIKYGIPSNLDPADVLAGPFHPAFGELVLQELLKRRIMSDPGLNERLEQRELQLLKAHGGVIFP